DRGTWRRSSRTVAGDFHQGGKSTTNPDCSRGAVCGPGMAGEGISAQRRSRAAGRVSFNGKRVHTAERHSGMSRAAYWAAFCMAVWLTGTVCVAVVATQNFFTIDRLLAESPNESFHVAVKTLDSVETAVHPTARELLRYLSAELNRLYFQYWNLAQMAIGILVLRFVTKIPGADRAKWCIV